MAEPRRRLLPALLILGICVAVLALSRDVWLGALARALILDEPPVKADAALVLAGDYTGQRILKGAELVRQGFAPTAFVSGPADFFGSHESEHAVAFAVRKGYPSEYFVPLPNQALSTADEAAHFVPELDRRGIRTLLLVTSDYHTARAARIFRAAARARNSPLRIHPVAVYHPGRNLANWWHGREGRKTVFFESAKTLATALGL